MPRSRAQRAAIAIHERQGEAKKQPGKKAAAKKTAGKKIAAKKAAAKKTSGKKVAVKKTATKRAAGEAAAKKTPAKRAARSASKSASAKPPSRRTGSLPKEGKDPKGGLTAAGRKFYNEQTGGHLRPGVKGTPKNAEEKQRKGSFLTRHFTTPPGPVVKDGEPTRQALQAAAWGEPVPKSEADEKKLAAKGRKLLDEAKAEKQ